LAKVIVFPPSGKFTRTVVAHARISWFSNCDAIISNCLGCRYCKQFGEMMRRLGVAKLNSCASSLMDMATRYGMREN